MKPAVWKPWRTAWAVCCFWAGVPLRKAEKSMSCKKSIHAYSRPRNQYYRNDEVVLGNCLVDFDVCHG